MTFSMKTTAAAMALSLATMSVASVATTSQAEAAGGRNAAFAAGAALGLLAGAAAAHSSHRAQPVKVCEWRTRREIRHNQRVRIKYKACWYE